MDTAILDLLDALAVELDIILGQAGGRWKPAWVHNQNVLCMPKAEFLVRYKEPMPNAVNLPKDCLG